MGNNVISKLQKKIASSVPSFQQYPPSFRPFPNAYLKTVYQPARLLGIFLQCLYESYHANSGEGEIIPNWTCSRFWGSPICSNKTKTKRQFLTEIVLLSKDCPIRSSFCSNIDFTILQKVLRKKIKYGLFKQIEKQNTITHKERLHVLSWAA